MIFTVHIGTEEGLSRWRDALQRHADWLGLSVRAGAIPLPEARAFRFAWIGPASLVGPDGILPRALDAIPPCVLTTSGGLAPATGELQRLLTDPRQPAATRIGLLQSGELLAAVPPGAVEQLCFARVSGGWVLSNDLRLMARIAGAELDETGVLGLFRYGLTPAPFTIFRRVQRVPVGHILRIAPRAKESSLEAFARFGDPSHREPEAVDPEAYIRDTLDEMLRRAPQSPIVYFSGGVDSSLIAARLAALGRMDAVLAHYTFGPDDELSQSAVRVAKHLGLRCEQFRWDPAGIPVVLERLGRDYPFPFCDASLIPGNLLAHSALPLAASSRAAIHGVGVGALFGQRLHIRRLWRPVGWIPRPIRRSLAWPYRAFRLWRRDSGDARALLVLHRSAVVPIVHTMMNEHAMEGIAYHMPADAGDRLDDAIRAHVEVLAARRDYDLLTSVVHQMYATSREFSAIALGPQMAQGVKTLAPFMEPLMMQRAFSLSWEEKCPGGVPKGLLRNLLAQDLPPHLAQIHGGSFLAPHTEIYPHPAMRQLVHEILLAPDNPVLEFCRASVVRDMLARLQNGQPLSLGARKFVWTVVFASGWLRQISTKL